MEKKKKRTDDSKHFKGSSKGFVSWIIPMEDAPQDAKDYVKISKRKNS